MNDKVGVKDDKGKLRMDLIPVEAEEALAEILSYGASKYEDRNWEKGLKYGRVYGALRRHLAAWMRGVKIDEESGLPHLNHAYCCLTFLVTYEARHMNSFDDLTPQPGYPTPTEILWSSLVDHSRPSSIQGAGTGVIPETKATVSAPMSRDTSNIEISGDTKETLHAGKERNASDRSVQKETEYLSKKEEIQRSGMEEKGERDEEHEQPEKGTGVIFRNDQGLRREMCVMSGEKAGSSSIASCKLGREGRPDTPSRIDTELLLKIEEGGIPQGPGITMRDMPSDSTKEKISKSLTRLYVCAPLSGDISKNCDAVDRKLKQMANAGRLEGKVPWVPHLALLGLTFTMQGELNREWGMEICLHMVKWSDEVLVLGHVMTEGMKEEIKLAEKLGKPVRREPW
jgi:hypothetical protein